MFYDIYRVPIMTLFPPKLGRPLLAEDVLKSIKKKSFNNFF